MKRISKSDSPLLKQFKRWTKYLLDANPEYVQDPKRLQRYIQGPNWDASDVEYAHYKCTISMYGDELLGIFERLRSAEYGEGLNEYRGMLKQAGIEEMS